MLLSNGQFLVLVNLPPERSHAGGGSSRFVDDDILPPCPVYSVTRFTLSVTKRGLRPVVENVRQPESIQYVSIACVNTVTKLWSYGNVLYLYWV